ncbi:MAG: hypothetical protein C5B60_04770 [Chloroflexi bacterium]|nr:MAG: hypothetical protein C5B60_04770 [Chloroflexota bacterium]
MSQTPEGKVKDEISKGLNSLGEDCHFEMPVNYGYGRRSIDYIGCFKGRYFGIEAKSPSKRSKPTRIQELILAKIRRAGGIGIVARSWADVWTVFYLERLLNEPLK